MLAVDEASAPASTWLSPPGITSTCSTRKLTIFFFAFLPSSCPPAAARCRAMLGLSAVFMAVTFVVFAAYGACAAALRDQVLSRPKVVDRLARRSPRASRCSRTARVRGALR